MPLQSGTTIGPYQIDVPLGAGGMGEVYKATDTRLDRTVAIKVLPEHVAADWELEERPRTISGRAGGDRCIRDVIGDYNGCPGLALTGSDR